MDTTNNSQTNNSPEPITPKLSVDLIIDTGAGLIVMVERKNEPFGWALPGGFVDPGESAEEAALREAKEETGLEIELVRQFHLYSEPKRDPRGATASMVFVARAKGALKAGSDAQNVATYHQANLPSEICFDHRQILNDYFLERY
jgi:8-oxo-dGTP diphosphatase